MRTIIICLAMWPFLLNGQTVFFHFTNGVTYSYDVSEIRKLTFEGDQQVLTLQDGSEYAWNVSTIGHYDFQQTTGIEHIASGNEPMPLRLYPNPSEGHVTIEFDLSETGPVLVQVFDLRGQLLRSLENRIMSRGTIRMIWDGMDSQGTRIPKGTYLVRVQGLAGATTRKLIMH